MARSLHLALLPLSLIACRKGGADDSGFNGNPGYDSDAPELVDTGDTGGVPQVEVDLEPSCPHEVPPNTFTGGLVYLADLQPVSGEYRITYTGARVVETTGTVRWGEGLLVSDSTYLEGYTQLSAHTELSFTLEPNGDSTAEGVTTRVELDGTENTGEWTETKIGCTRIQETYKPDIDEYTIRTTTLVSPDRAEWTYEASNSGGTGWTFSSWGVDTSDWTTLYSFETDNPETEVNPERMGSCEVYGAGYTTCLMTQYSSATAWQTGDHRWELNGDHTVSWERHDQSYEPALRQWGTDFQTYAGDGWTEWTFLEVNTNREVRCSGSWDTAGVGAWSCDNGHSGTYPRGG